MLYEICEIQISTQSDRCLLISSIYFTLSVDYESGQRTKTLIIQVSLCECVNLRAVWSFAVRKLFKGA